MKRERILKEAADFCKRFIVIYGFTMLATLFFMALFNRSGLVGWQYFLWCVFFSLAANLPSLIFLSGQELSGEEWDRRFALNVVLTVLILMPLGYHRMWSGWGGGVLFFLMIIAINFGVRAVGFGMDAHTANLLNEQLRKRRLEQKKGGDNEQG